jgi:hypothetical protein
MNIKILVIEDTDDVAERLKSAIEWKMRNIGHDPEVEICNDFETAPRILRRFRPHAVTLDLKRDPIDDHAAKPAWEVVRQEHFCPVLFYSAVPIPSDVLETELPFARYLRKVADRTGDEAAAAEIIGGFVPHIQGLQNLWNDVERRYAQSLQKVSSLIWKSEKEENARAEALIRITRRRLAATLEHPLGREANIKAWEQFIYPPIDVSLCTGDILKKNGGIGEPGDFRVILSPPCDLVAEPTRHPVAEVLCAKCVTVRHPDVLRKTSLKAFKVDGQPNTNLPTQLGNKLSGDKCDGMIVIPKLEGVFPAMVLDLKSFEMIDRAKIALYQESVAADSVYVRLASMDSPFREALSWRFTHSVGRPGYPLMDETSLAKDVEEEAKKG